MDLKKSLLVICFILCIFFSISSVVADDVNDTAIISEDSDNILEECDGEKPVSSIGMEKEESMSDEFDSAKDNDETVDEVSEQSSDLLKSTDCEEIANSLSQTTISSSKSYDVSNFNELESALSSDKYDTVTINIKSNIKFTKWLDLSPSINTLTINGNGKTINGDDGDCKHQFLYMESGVLTIKNIRIINCEASYGAAIKIDAGKLTAVNCIFENNNVLRYGGAIYNSGDNTLIKDCTFRNNLACKDLDSTGVYVYGGAIYNSGDNVEITGCTFENNVAKTYGSGLDIDNRQVWGGAIFNCGDNAEITNNIFKKNTAEEGSAIYTSGSNVLINSNTFKLNNAVSSRKDDPIVYMYSGGFFKEIDKSDNIFISDTKCYSTIFNRFGSMEVTNNKFDDRLDTTIISPSVVKYGNYLVITLKDANGNVLKGVKVSVNIKNTKTLKTNNKGQIKISSNSLVPKTYTAKISFKGNSKYAPSTKSVKVTVKKATPKITAKAKTFKKSVKTKKYTITLKTNQNKAMKKTKITLKVNKKTYTAKTNSKGKATFKITKLTKKRTYKATVTYKGNKYYNKVTKKVNIKIK